MNLNSESAIAVVRLLVALIVSIAAILGVSLDPEVVNIIVAIAAAVVVLAWVWWRNNNLTKAAQEAQKVLNSIKRGDYYEDCVEGCAEEVAPETSEEE